jgi:Big-like domain-containing protein
MHSVLFRGIALVSSVAALLLGHTAPVAAQSADWQPGPGAALDNTYEGFIDLPANGATVPGGGSSFTVAGWFVDKTAQGWAGADDVQVWLGAMDGGGQMLARALFAQSRPDVGAAEGNPFWDDSGFVATIAGSSVPNGTQTLNLYAHTPAKGWWFKSVAVTGGGSATTAPAAAPAPSAGGAPQLTILNPTNNQNVSTKSDYTINGRVDDSRDNIDVWINGERDTHYATELGTTTPTSDGSWSLTFTPTHFPSTHSILYIYAKNRASGLETLVSVEINIVDH